VKRARSKEGKQEKRGERGVRRGVVGRVAQAKKRAGQSPKGKKKGGNVRDREGDRREERRAS
jgi:hypothetical protein